MGCQKLAIFMSCAFPPSQLVLLLQGGEPNPAALQHVDPAFSTENPLKSLDSGLPQT